VYESARGAPVQNRVTQHLIFVPLLAPDAIQVAADGRRALYKIGDIEGTNGQVTALLIRRAARWWEVSPACRPGR
jgi:hypothetical protein